MLAPSSVNSIGLPVSLFLLDVEASDNSVQS